MPNKKRENENIEEKKRLQTHTKVKTEDTLSGFQGCCFFSNFI